MMSIARHEFFIASPAMTKIQIQLRFFAHFTALAILASLATAHAQSPEVADVKRRAHAAYSDIKVTLGVVPEFMRAFPEEALPGAWQEMKKVELSRESALSPKQKELIGLAVASQMPCQYCVILHTALARYYGASDQELKESVATAASTRHWSTILDGADFDMKQFNQDIDRMARRMELQTKAQAKAQAGTAAPGQPGTSEFMDPPMSRNNAVKEIQETFGFLPRFLAALPQDALPGAWAEYKGLYQSRTTEISAKDKNLISLAVAAQIPCTYCVKMDRRFAKATGATEDELKNAVAMASLTRHWGAIFSGMQIDESQFRAEVQQIVQHFRQTAPPVKQLGGEVPVSAESQGTSP